LDRHTDTYLHPNPRYSGQRSGNDDTDRGKLDGNAHQHSNFDCHVYNDSLVHSLTDTNIFTYADTLFHGHAPAYPDPAVNSYSYLAASAA
jgi:hypothetical protein